ncbi:hypothetical protein A2U01_0046604 [Trifolium medium]|uniref:Uncharacterized protein n=1 Tax=Trifolium medium TaxID=97028 RepID=A0A392QLY6_9FABA|nr:hypothetical protein [Trifolium medium]
MEIDEALNFKDTETCPHPSIEINSHITLEENTAEKQPLENSFLRTNIYEDAPLKLTFDETLLIWKRR